ncbi:MAG: zinc-binding dehydrogenase [Candidatus Dormibacteraeota bacterium]|nr:zinc-binding dehydrogenase [Candidatus Dormibacteraeota bacterium]
MKALVVDPALAHAGGRRQRRAGADVLPLDVREVVTPTPPAPGWVLVRPALAGICARDLDLIHADRVPDVLTAYRDGAVVVPGHEVVGVVEQASPTRWAKEGSRVLVEPTLRCAHKGLPECRRCRAGDTHLCENADRAGALCSGPSVGSSVEAGGGWSEGLLVHEDMLVPAEGISDQRGVLAEPAASALHAVLRWFRRGDCAVVIGAGAQSRLIVATLRRMYSDLDITVLYDARSMTRPRRGRRFRQPLHLQHDIGPDVVAIRALGASRVWRGPAEELLLRTADLTGSRLMRPKSGGTPVLDGGVDVIFDCRADPTSVDLSLRLLRAGGTLVLCGRPDRQAVEWPLVWSRELTVTGAARYGKEPSGHRTFAVVREWLADPAFPVDGIVTHRFPLEDFDTALETATAGVSAGAVKVVFEGPVAAMRTRMDEAATHVEPLEEPLLHATAARARNGR